MPKLDAKNHHIISELQKDARISYTQLGKKVLLSRAMVKQRVEVLQKEGVIRSFETRINYKRLGFTHYECWLSFHNLSPKKKEEIINWFTSHPFSHWVGECLSTYNFRVTFIAADQQHMENISSEIRLVFGDILSTIKILTITGIIKFIPQNLIEEKKPMKQPQLTKNKPVKIDQIDIILLENLSKNTRIRFSELADQTGLTLQGVRQRVHRLEQEEVILHYSINIDRVAIEKLWMILLCNFTNLQEDTKNKLAQYILTKKFVGNTYILLGNWHYSMTLNANTVADLADYVSDLELTFTKELSSYLPIIITKSHKYPKVAWGAFTLLRKQLNKS